MGTKKRNLNRKSAHYTSKRVELATATEIVRIGDIDEQCGLPTYEWHLLVVSLP